MNLRKYTAIIVFCISFISTIKKGAKLPSIFWMIEMAAHLMTRNIPITQV
ncbi:hypothetical protein BTN50_1875 [Candidatus Enterovibrio altilux]|uniref:Mobile element protein n=1 Tax=Candidatus Enterovibrio altilux TaxID=1927128 RepID=A0A291BBG9_9GAMM|nr:hypothetical protein BTN50_1875 [Candidatus Enterovibrio luxaltus]